MNYQDKIISNLAKKYNLDSRIVKSIVYSPLKFTNRIVKHNMDMRPIRIMYFGVFMQKERKNKKNRMNRFVEELLNNMDEVIIVMGSTLQFPISTMKGAEKIINDANDSDDYEKIKMIWDAWQEYIK